MQVGGRKIVYICLTEDTFIQAESERIIYTMQEDIVTSRPKGNFCG